MERKFPKNTVIYFWYWNESLNDYNIYKGTIHHWLCLPGKEPVAYINSGYSIYLPVERLFINKEECELEVKSLIRNKLLNEIL